VIVVRRLQDDERSMVFADWIRSYRTSLDVIGVLPRDYDTGMDRRVKHILARCPVYGAVHSDVPGEVLGWCCTDGRTVHYVYVKHAARRHGVASELVLACAPDARRYSHRTYVVRDIDLGPMTFDPFEADT